MFYLTVLSQLKYASEVASKNMIITYWILFDTPIPHIMYTLLTNQPQNIAVIVIGGFMLGQLLNTYFSD